MGTGVCLQLNQQTSFSNRLRIIYLTTIPSDLKIEVSEYLFSYQILIISHDKTCFVRRGNEEKFSNKINGEIIPKEVVELKRTNYLKYLFNLALIKCYSISTEILNKKFICKSIADNIISDNLEAYLEGVKQLHEVFTGEKRLSSQDYLEYIINKVRGSFYYDKIPDREVLDRMLIPNPIKINLYSAKVSDYEVGITALLKTHSTDIIFKQNIKAINSHFILPHEIDKALKEENYSYVTSFFERQGMIVINNLSDHLNSRYFKNKIERGCILIKDQNEDRVSVISQAFIKEITTNKINAWAVLERKHKFIYKWDRERYIKKFDIYYHSLLLEILPENEQNYKFLFDIYSERIDISFVLTIRGIQKSLEENYSFIDQTLISEINNKLNCLKELKCIPNSAEVHSLETLNTLLNSKGSISRFLFRQNIQREIKQWWETYSQQTQRECKLDCVRL